MQARKNGSSTHPSTSPWIITNDNQPIEFFMSVSLFKGNDRYSTISSKLSFPAFIMRMAIFLRYFSCPSRRVVVSIPSSMSCTLTSFHHAASHVQLLRPHLWWNCSQQFCRKKKTHFYQRRYVDNCHPRDKAPTQPSFNCCINNSTFQSAVP